MSTDKTLADVQPGGRVRLGDRNGSLAVSLRQIADAQYTRRQRFNGRLPADVQEVIRMAADALSAQPSPGGQGDALAMEMACSEMHAVVQRAGGYRIGLLAEMLEKGMATLAARQPVGEPVAVTQFRYPECSDWYDVTDANQHVLTDPDYEKRTLYAAPPGGSE